MSILKRSGEAARSLAYGGGPKWVDLGYWSFWSKPSAQNNQAPRTFFHTGSPGRLAGRLPVLGQQS